MSILRPVADLDADDARSWWRTTAGAPFRTVVLDGCLPEGEIGALLYGLAVKCRPDDSASGDAGPGGDDPVHAEDAASWIIAAQSLPVTGGLRAEDDAGVHIAPGCCCDVGDWRDWTGITERTDLWLGHDPDPWIEYCDAGLRVHPSGALGERVPTTGFVEFRYAALPDLLRQVQRDLLAFLGAVDGWARQVVPRHRADLVAVLDEQLQIGAPLLV